MKNIKFSYTRERLYPGYDGCTCKICPHIACDGEGTALLQYGMLLLSGSDVGVGGYIHKSTDGGVTFGEPHPVYMVEKTEGEIRTTIGGGQLLYNRFHKKWLMLGTMAKFYGYKEPVCINGIQTADPYLTVFDAEKMEIEPEMTPIPFPFDYVSATPHGQPIELDNGDMLLTFYYTGEDFKAARSVCVRYALRGNRLEPVTVGEPVIPGEGFKRGVYEPSLARLGDKYYLALRSDEIGLFCVSDDGYHFDEPRPYVWDDGSVLENYNTMQRWVRTPDGLFLVYNRKGAHNDHVFRHRAPLFMTRFDEERQCLIRSEEIVAVPELGARLGNFYVTDVSDRESWITVGEWMQPEGCEKYGSDNSVWITRIKFE